MKGTLHAFFKDYKSREVTVQLSITDCSVMESLEPLLEQDIDVEIKKWREKRSLSANAYFHVLCHKLAEALRISDARCKNMLITKYGQPQHIDGEIMVMKTNIPPEYMWEQEGMHCRPIQGPDPNAEWYVVYRGSHEYDTAEMARLIDMTVEDCKELGIETMLPEDLERLKRSWHGKV